VSWEAVEAAFWQIVEEGEEAIDVIYGADLDSTVLGSGFPKKDGRLAGDRYALEPWNLNNFPRLQGANWLPCSAGHLAVILAGLYSLSAVPCASASHALQAHIQHNMLLVALQPFGIYHNQEESSH
jgi:hypothetical protein